MCERSVLGWSRLSAVLIFAVGLCTYPALCAEQGSAKEILSVSGVKGGLIVHLGCGDGKLTAALRANDSTIVHGLDTSAENVATAREHIRKLGLYGKVSVDQWDGKRLPYIDNFANLIVASGEWGVESDEIVRVLAPNGVALLTNPKSKIQNPKLHKPWPKNIDEWTHYLHGPDNNAVAQDTVVGLPKHYQWIAAPTWLRHHDSLSGLSAMVSTKGRIFYIIDLGPRWSIQMPPRWALMARDAFNGVLLWQRPIKKWHAHLWPLKRSPARLMRRLVAKDDTVYATLGVGEPVTALDAATGRTLRTYTGTEGTEEMILADGVLYAVVNPELDAYKNLPQESVQMLRRAGRNWNWNEKPRRLAAFDAGTGKALWSREQVIAPCTLASAGGRVYLHDGDKVLCLDAKDGNEVWASKPIPRWKPMHVFFGPTLIVHEDVVLFAGGEKMDPQRGGDDTMTALSTKDGKFLWTAPHPQSGYASSEDLFVINDLAWCGMTTLPSYPGTFTGRDLHTGKVKVEFPADDWRHMPHHRCYRAKATTKYILTSRTGIEFVDLAAKHWNSYHWVRGSCNYGIMPCNGLIYAPPHSCACYLLAKLNSFNAIAADSPTRRVPESVPDADRLLQGPAFSEIENRKSAIENSDDWPTFRHDPARSGSTKTSVPTELKQIWQTDINEWHGLPASRGTRLSTAVVAGGKVFVAAVDDHTVHALDAASGQKVWSFTTGGRVDSPPTVWQGRVIFGSADGYVRCLRASDGALVWRFRAAPVDRRLVAYDQVESVWPVHGSVLVCDGVVYCVAGRTMWLDGGMRLLRLDAKTGKKISETILDDKYPGTKDNLQKNMKWPNLPVALPDVLSYDGRYVYMRSQPFTVEGKRTEVITPRDYKKQKGETAHLFSPTGFLDGSWWHRTYWMYGRSYISAAGGWDLATYQAPAGRIMSVDGDTIYGYGRAPMKFRGTPNTYHLWTCSTEPKIINPNPKRKPSRRGASLYGLRIPTRMDYRWTETMPLLVRAMVVTDEAVFTAGPMAKVDEMDVYMGYGDPDVQARMREHVASFEGKRGAFVMAVSKADGKKLCAYRLKSAPIFDGMIAANGRLFVSTADGKVLCLGAGEGRALPKAPDVTVGPPPDVRGSFIGMKSHPDFQKLHAVRIVKCDIGYRISTAPHETGMALRKLDKPLKKRAEFRVKVRPVPGAKDPDAPGNAFLVFGDAPKKERLVTCGFRLSGKSLHFVPGPLIKSKALGKRFSARANEVAEMRVVVDLEKQTASISMNDGVVEVQLSGLDTISWVGCCVASVTADFGKIEVKGE
ncbi:MAG: PQQ-binding-like beta-propeller repeat protein [Planctomycetes bacterium]|nr:PQQ-binding-like beta-propeller repeat protein [Planctomycetota bacterium]